MDNDEQELDVDVGYILDKQTEEIWHIIQLQSTPKFLDALALSALQPHLTLRLYVKYEEIFADTLARWLTTGIPENQIIVAIAQILPFAPYCIAFLENYLESKIKFRGKLSFFNADEAEIHNLETTELQKILLAIWRLLNFNKYFFSTTVQFIKIQSLFKHKDLAVRFLAIRVFSQIMSAADFKLEEMNEKYIGKESIVWGDFDGMKKDIAFLSLLEENRFQDVRKSMMDQHKFSKNCLDKYNLDNISPFVIRCGSILYPRPSGPSKLKSLIIHTVTMSRNIERFAKALKMGSPILLHGLAGSGKTLLVQHFARELSIVSKMVTLHLNEQTDAKMLLGTYVTGRAPGTFVWKAGILTTAISEGRWVFIEDLDRAPNEVISILLPLIEKGELFIPSRGETIKAGRGFQLLASLRTSQGLGGEEKFPSLHTLGARLWQRTPVEPASEVELHQIINGIHPILHEYLPTILNVYNRVSSLSQNSASIYPATRGLFGRAICPRDLLKWCKRLEGLLLRCGIKNSREQITDEIRYEFFMEATDCFAASLQVADVRRNFILCIAEEMLISPQNAEFFISSHIPKYEEKGKEITIGRVTLPTLNCIENVDKKSRLFANTSHAKRLLEQVGVSVKWSEPCLLIGETGIGKTTVIQHLANRLGYKLTVVNLSQQTEAGDLLGGYKPVNIRTLAMPLKNDADDLFASIGLSANKNQKYLDQLSKYVAKRQWIKALRLWREVPKIYDQFLSTIKKGESYKLASSAESEQPSKRRKTESRLKNLLELKPRIDKFSKNLDQFEIQLSGGSKSFAFSFIESNIIKAARNGDWVLLDEINLAPPDTIESIADLLHHGPTETPSILLSETGEIERIYAHPNFRIFGAMNPATDIGKHDLLPGIRSRFTEIYVESPDKNLDDLLIVIKSYLKTVTKNDERVSYDVAKLYLNIKRLVDEKKLVDGANNVPHFSLRTLTRVLSYVSDIAPLYGTRRALCEGFAMGFLTLLDRESEKILSPLIDHYLLGNHKNVKSLLSQKPNCPEDDRPYVHFKSAKQDRHYWLLQGAETCQEFQDYIRTPFVERNLLNLVRATSIRRYPVLVQGPTSSGKTSMIQFLARYSGNKCVRINNHENTDLQEYLGSYISGNDGQLRFQEGLLVQALRQGYWIVLDELNLAPTDVLEALNRLLDDNRELFIPETQEIVHPHENFMLFATQNPPGIYGGRKTLSRAFRNRFLELHFDDIPEDELETIMQTRCKNVAPSDCKRIVTVYKELSRLRLLTRVFEKKDGFATLRDLFRWALREYETREQLAFNGYMLLVERIRKPEERDAVTKIIERVMKVKINPSQIYDHKLSAEIQFHNVAPSKQGVVWTNAMRRLYILVSHAIRHNEPVLLIGETGCGKTTVCQMLADAFSKKLSIVNAHQNTETGDIIGAQRPIRNRSVILENLRKDLVLAMKLLEREVLDFDDLDYLLDSFKLVPEASLHKLPLELHQNIQLNQAKSKALFEWSDGSLVQAMREGHFFLLDEISLADDAVLERLNSVLETERTILLAEKGVDNSLVKAINGFQFLATMNPGGDYGKRELSPALRNRFTEIWVPALSDYDDIYQIVESKLGQEWKIYSRAMVQFAEWFGQEYRSTSVSISVRDMLAWTEFMNNCPTGNPHFFVVQGASLVYIDTLGANPAALLSRNTESIQKEREKCLLKLGSLLDFNVMPSYFNNINILNTEHHLQIGEFSIEKRFGKNESQEYAFEAKTTKINAMRVIRALQVKKPILIEGNPGVGKTTLIAAIARICNQPLTRINLSEQTDLMDLFGSDVPVEGAEVGKFAWRDAPFLQAMQRGEWVLLDEMNLASQSVLEGLNACLDHRGEVYISELDHTFKCHPNFFVFAAQNPHHQGGGRKGLPSSFVNRFTVVYADIFKEDDLQLICQQKFPSLPGDLIGKIITLVLHLEEEVVHKRTFGTQGGPWEFNLRDILRWLQLLTSEKNFFKFTQPSDFLDFALRHRFRTSKDRLELDRVFADKFSSSSPPRHLFHSISSRAYQVGLAYLPRNLINQTGTLPGMNLNNRLSELESTMICIQENIPCILVGPSGSGKTTILQHISNVVGKELLTFPLTSDTDTMDLIGGYEQVDPQRNAIKFLDELEIFCSQKALSILPDKLPEQVISVIESLKQRGPNLSHLLSSLSHLLHNMEAETTQEDFGRLASCCKELSETTMILDSAHFEWCDGALIKALEQGKWLVLDNANLCSASVLDRLNSLLEPDGFLLINEYNSESGKPKIVKPHSDFRIFLTMDPKFGELSRAMRNRAVEIFVEPLSDTAPVEILGVNHEASMQRFRILSQSLKNLEIKTLHSTASIAIENLSWSDMTLLPRFIASLDPTYSKELMPLCQDYIALQEEPENQKIRNLLKDSISVFNDPYPRDIQIVHPLQNSPMVNVIVQSQKSKVVYWLGAAIDILLEIGEASRVLNNEVISIENKKPSKMNRFQRSIMKEQVSAVANDSTVSVAYFLQFTLQLLRRFSQNYTPDHDQWLRSKMVISSLLQYWRYTLHLVTEKLFDEVTFQAHLAIGRELLPEYSSNEYPIIQSFKEELEKNFCSKFKLTTGISMGIIWNCLRPKSIRSSNVFDSLSKMKELAIRFDTMRWKTAASVQNLANIMDSLVRAYQIILETEVDGTALISSLAHEMKILECGMEKIEDKTTPYFRTQFEAIRQYKTLESICSNNYEDKSDLELLVLSDYSTVCQMNFRSATPSSVFFQAIDYLLCENGNFNPTNSTLLSGLLVALRGIDKVELKALSLLELELPILGQKLALICENICQNQLLLLNKILLQLIHSFIEIHGMRSLSYWRDLCQSNSSSDFLEHSSHASVNANLREVIQDHFLPSFQLAMTSDNHDITMFQSSALAWIHFAIGCIILYVPDRAIDPEKKQRLETERFNTAKNKLSEKLDALKRFEYFFSKNNTNIRCELLESELTELGVLPEDLQDIYRPAESEINQLQGEFNNLLKIVLGSDIIACISNLFKTQSGANDHVIQLLQRNVAKIYNRLTRGFQAYGDIIQPILSMIKCLQIGLSFAVIGVNLPSDGEKFRGYGDLISIMTGFGDKIETGSIAGFNFPEEYLAFVAINSASEGSNYLKTKARESLLRVVHEYYDKWSSQLEIDRLEAESKSRLYQFRGANSDQEEIEKQEYEQIFPSYEEETSPSTKFLEATYIRDTAVRFAKLHAEIFLNPVEPADSIKNLIRSSSLRSISDPNYSNADPSSKARSLPGSLLLLDDKIREFNSEITPQYYNFYLDPNLSECRKLVKLSQRIQNRFRELQSIDDIGHMQPLEDVIVSCNELLQFRHIEPLAKIITKVEKIHTYLHEWQFGGWASRANSVLEYYQEITTTIVRWRRLELSTWSRLFDMEVKKCEDDAKSWWFIAYQIVIAAPLQISESESNVRNYAQKLLKDLETYFSSAILGQFSQRLQLMKQLQKHLEILELEVPTMSIIMKAVANFVNFYSRYEKPVQETLMKGRTSLDKMMHDISLMASWKDTNIVALRDSAKRSHHKLFKVIRKFRALLGQPMEIVLMQGLPQEKSTDDSTQQILGSPAGVEPSALAVCESFVPRWSEKSKRFVNISQTTSLMANTAVIPESVVDISSYLEEFVTSLTSAVSELQKMTPSKLTDENKDQVKHLKTRKKKLFADTLKELRRMGIKSHLSSDALQKQESLSYVLSQLDFFGDVTTDKVQYHFHTAIDIVPRARNSVKGHSIDLSSVDVEKSIGLMEGLHQTIFSQHNFLLKTASSMKALDTSLQMMKGLWTHDYNIKNHSRSTNHYRYLQWLPTVLLVGNDLIEIHSKFRGFDCSAINANFKNWISQFTQLKVQWDSLPCIPSQVISTEILNLYSKIDDLVGQLILDLKSVLEGYPCLEFIINQIIPWTRMPQPENESHSNQSSISQLDCKLSELCDSVLVAIENYSRLVSTLPKSSEDAGWLVQNNSISQNSLSTLHIETIYRLVQESFEILGRLNLKDDQISTTSAACFAVALPILEQYFIIVQNSYRRYVLIHMASCKTLYILAKTFIQIATQGFCSPSEGPDTKESQSEKLEDGTGLGDGEGAEDISKDIQDDEDLNELAQEPNTDRESEMKNEEDAIDITNDDMEGEMEDSKEGKEDDEGSEDENTEDEMNEETGDVDDLDPTAVDEKMWDDGGKEAEKDQQGDESKGETKKDEQVASESSEKEKVEEDETNQSQEEEMAGEEQGEEIKPNEIENHDPHVQESEVLDLPEDLNLDGEDSKSASEEDGLEDLSDVEDSKNLDEMPDDDQKQETPDEESNQPNEGPLSDVDEMDLDKNEVEDNQKNEGEDEDEKMEEADQTQDEVEDQACEDENSFHHHDEVKIDDMEGFSSNDHGGDKSQDKEVNKNQENASKTQEDESEQDGEASSGKNFESELNNQGEMGKGEAPQDMANETQDSNSAQPFKKLGDVLDNWYRQQNDIRDPCEQQDSKKDPIKDAIDFQHLKSENDESDAQALGNTTEDQAHALDDAMAVDQQIKDEFEKMVSAENEKNYDSDCDRDIDDPMAQKDDEHSDASEGQLGAVIYQPKENPIDDDTQIFDQDIEQKVEEVDHQLESVHLESEVSLRPFKLSYEQWNHYEGLTRDLSLSLTEQLRLILAPTLATKMRGDFRTGKRLNIKRIIPYIASQFKRDKIWMRRSVPSKRNYQVMLAVDDSKSMGESGSGSLAFETLVMVSKSLSMLEVGEICMVGFGENVKIAHDFDVPFTSDAGPRALQHFCFQQNRTDIARLVAESIEIFRTARAKASSRPADLWQMEIIISDGICESRDHEEIRRLLREALQERIMMIFVIVDDVKSKKNGQSVVELNQAVFVNGAVVTSRYLDSFPFQYYVIVSDIKELPSVLATLLRQWFQEVVEYSN
ncbi:Bgt-5184 [Blumeria graminis f. sp. tritici]|uniref:Midasin n=3 Tax=Blumeria graminis f. sp. tritici TaxID=62690 RepID=A0A656KEU3_BLUGR|nr:Huge dynein-related AAA-type ATPase [Blumeria graminis f. sp. tritici 96224]VDB96310.1 Bgt-5184 [Blumeria graminis f. sp. tritici]